MYSILITFQFSDINDKQYELILFTSKKNSSDLNNALSAMNNDSHFFKFVKNETIDDDIIVYYEGTLVGDVISEDNERDDFFDPLIETKLKFNIGCQEFPSWLVDLCDYYLNVRVILWEVDNNNERIERWRGFLMANTLSMPIVNQYLSCQMIAVDEIGISKYLQLSRTYPQSNDNSWYHRDILHYLTTYWDMMCYSVPGIDLRFSYIYGIYGYTIGNKVYCQTNIYYQENLSNEDNPYLLKLVLNINKYLTEEKATWHDLFSDICSYFCARLYMGSSNGNAFNDNYYFISNNTSPIYQVYELDTGAAASIGNRLFNIFGNQIKIGGDVKLSYKPNDCKGLKVKSKPIRPEIHTYLDDENVKEITPESGHDKWCLTQVGTSRTQTTLDEYKYRVFQLVDIISKQDQFIAEDNYVSLNPCETSFRGYQLASNGYFPFNNTANAYSRTRPNGNDTDNLDFVLIKQGVVAARIGEFDTWSESFNPNLKNYFVILNNCWGRCFWNGDAMLDPVNQNAFQMAVFKPFANDRSLRPNPTKNETFLKIDFNALILNENIGRLKYSNNGTIDDITGKIQEVFPIRDSYYDWNAGDSAQFTGNLASSTGTNYVVPPYRFPVLRCRLSIGNYYFNGTEWSYVNPTADTPPTFSMRLAPDETDNYWPASTGEMKKDVMNYYYTNCKPIVSDASDAFRVPLYGLSTSSRPLDGEVKFEIWGPIPFANAFHNEMYDYYWYNNILFVLISDLKIEFEDMALVEDKDISNLAIVTRDSNSETKLYKEISINLATPSVNGVFTNCFLAKKNDKWVNVQSFKYLGDEYGSMEEIIAYKRSFIYCQKQIFIELNRPINHDNIYNMDFIVTQLTEYEGQFMPLARKFNWTKGFVNWKLQRTFYENSTPN